MSLTGKRTGQDWILGTKIEYEMFIKDPSHKGLDPGLHWSNKEENSVDS